MSAKHMSAKHMSAKHIGSVASGSAEPGATAKGVRTGDAALQLVSLVSRMWLGGRAPPPLSVLGGYWLALL
jgi:hypothetical protein